MRRAFLVAWLGVAALGAGGCASGPWLDNPAVLRPDMTAPVENPLFLPQGPGAYATVFEKVLDTVDDYFEISYSNRYDGRIETFPRIAPGFEQPWRAGSVDCDQRLLATLQTIRQRAMVVIQPADDGGFFVDVKVFKELEDISKPTQPRTGAAVFRSDNTVERQYEVIDPTVLDSNWAPIGRNLLLEQVILQRLKKCL